MDHQVLNHDISPEELLTQAGLRKTPNWIALLHALRRAKEPLNAEQLFARAEMSSINRTTVYRALERLVGAKVITRLDLGRGHALYELSAGHHHHHFSCQRCHKISAVDVVGEKSLLQAIAKKYHVDIRHHAIEMTGVCADCKKK